ncbi:hypothetical protein EIN_170620 [Entamoeba invadens IP1]|uniref:N-acetyltransferase domain-containing protein n=1 Tax=Entamoeba invadens IP1 TaxID=370355 RepID=A0A0A1TVQ2_ENTIV|nr:hypothetical protein EIN_170620 [Entamoeba invadens IP1]ELP84537.1 hypothetical protein EIN_170620 [Entamoeba invadens IP1]|eukprot:XP_004183883.1 hypothetical protein EIN_170620 [Entamoeba invadens IP1]
MEEISCHPFEISQIQRLAQICFRDTYKAILSPTQMEYMIDWMYSDSSLKRQITEGCVYTLFQKNNTDVGYISVQKIGDVCHLHKIYLDPKEHKNGIGKVMMNCVKSWATQNYCKTIILNVNRFNKTIGFYQKMGFVVIRQEDNEIGNGFYMNDFVMEFVC